MSVEQLIADAARGADIVWKAKADLEACGWDVMAVCRAADRIEMLHGPEARRMALDLYTETGQLP